MERRTLEDWVIRPLLKGLPDVVDVNSLGGFVKQYQVIVEPGLASENMALPYTTSSMPSPRTMPMPAEISSRRTTKSTWFAAWG